MTNTTIKSDLLPSQEDIEFFKEKGWYKSPIVFSEAEIDAAVKGAHDFYDGKVDFKMKSMEGIANDHQDHSAAIRNNEFVTLQKKELQYLGHHPLVGAIASALVDSSEIRLFSDSLVNKMPTKRENPGIVGWHTDKAYWPTAVSNKLLTVWIPLQDVTLDMGPLTYVDESHKWKDEKELKSFYGFNNQNLKPLEQYLNEQKKDHTKSYMTLKKGQFSIHACHTIHSSVANTSNKNRMALAVHLQDGDNKYQEAFKPSGEKIVIGYDKICDKDANGNPDYKDKDIFPIIYKK